MSKKLAISDLPAYLQARVREQAAAEGLMMPKPAKREPKDGEKKGGGCVTILK